ncbi:arsenate reductase/protein-tyrosine-phosphatase family protein [Staphylococcus epidermidis]|nr:hypothetical protein [Staphylococcus epidermidis]
MIDVGFVCVGNICGCGMGEGMMRERVEERGI